MPKRQQPTVTEAVGRVVVLERELAQARAERDAAVVRRAAEGVSLRAVATEARMSHESVRRIVAAATPPEDGMLTLAEAAKHSGLGVEALLAKVADGKLPLTRRGDGVRFLLSDVDKL